MLMLALVAGGQTKPPLTCPKYQHVESVSPCGPIKCGKFDACACSSPNVDACVDDIHFVTEREWLELMARLKELENPSAKVTNAMKAST